MLCCELFYFIPSVHFLPSSLLCEIISASQSSLHLTLVVLFLTKRQDCETAFSFFIYGIIAPSFPLRYLFDLCHGRFHGGVTHGNKAGDEKMRNSNNAHFLPLSDVSTLVCSLSCVILLSVTLYFPSFCVLADFSGSGAPLLRLINRVSLLAGRGGSWGGGDGVSSWGKVDILWFDLIVFAQSMNTKLLTQQFLQVLYMQEKSRDSCRACDGGIPPSYLFQC